MPLQPSVVVGYPEFSFLSLSKLILLPATKNALWGCLQADAKNAVPAQVMAAVISSTTEHSFRGVDGIGPLDSSTWDASSLIQSQLASKSVTCQTER